MAKTGKAHKSAKNGQFVSEKFAESHPDTTYETDVKRGPTKKRKK